MKSSPKTATLFFDYDGTLHDCIRIYGPAFRKVYQNLIADGVAQPRAFSDQTLSAFLGLSAQEMWDQFMPHLPQDQKDCYGAQIGAEMFQRTVTGHAALYPGAADTLCRLKEQGYHMVFLSNCQRSYLDVHRKTFHLTRYFSDFFCAEDFPGKAKWEIYQAVRHRFPLPHVMIGDRSKDLEIAQRFHLPSVGCTYGYGTIDELASATLQIAAVTELVTAVKQVLDGCDNEF